MKVEVEEINAAMRKQAALEVGFFKKMVTLYLEDKSKQIHPKFDFSDIERLHERIDRALGALAGLHCELFRWVGPMPIGDQIDELQDLYDQAEKKDAADQAKAEEALLGIQRAG